MVTKCEDGAICLKARNIRKVYPGTVALDNVDFDIYKGKVNVLIGENGAGKSTLMKIIAGIEQATCGVLELNGKEIQIKSIKDAEKNGIGIIHQELNLFENLNVYQNIYMDKEMKRGGIFLDNKKHYEGAMKVLKKLEHPINPNMLVSQLKVGQQQIVEIAKTMVQEDLSVLIMDEPTSSLSTAEVEVLFKTIEELKSMGISIVYISHRMGEIMEIGDYVTVLRDGKRVAFEQVKNIDIAWMVGKMLGHQAENTKKQIREISEEKVLSVESLELINDHGNKVLDNVSLDLKKGEILGIYGLLGAGRTELLEVLMGMHPKAQGNIYLGDKKLKPGGINRHINMGFAHIPEDRQREGLIQTLDVEKNISISSLEKYTKAGLLSGKTEGKHVDGKIQDLKIRVADKKLPILSLSGGNQQKAVIAKALLTDPQIILLDEPSRGIDVGAKEEVFHIIRQLADQGKSIIVVASELKEILSISDRIIVLSSGKVTAEFHDSPEEWELAAAATM